MTPARAAAAAWLAIVVATAVGVLVAAGRLDAPLWVGWTLLAVAVGVPSLAAAALAVARPAERSGGWSLLDILGLLLELLFPFD